MNTEFKIDDVVEYYREPLKEEWDRVGEIDIQIPKNTPVYVKEVYNHEEKSIKLCDESGKEFFGYYPKEMFRLVNEESQLNFDI